MHITIDTRMIGEKQHGIARHTMSLIRHLEKWDQKNRYTLLVNHEFLKNKTHFNLHFMKSHWLSFGEQIEIPYVLKKLNSDLFHSPSFSIPFFCPTPFVMTIHDLNHIAFQDGKKWRYSFYYGTILKYALWRAKKIITVSHFTKGELIKYFKLPADRISVIPNGIEKDFFPMKDSAHLIYYQKKYNLPNRFILFIGNAKKHKNLNRVLAAFDNTLKKRISLVILGIEGENSNSIIYIPHVEEKELAYLYNLSTVVLFPSLYEGFGFPALEALACGKILITSNATSLPEVVDGSAILIDPTSVESIRQAITQTLSRKDLFEPNIPGIERAKQFSLDKAALETLEIYEK